MASNVQRILGEYIEGMISSTRSLLRKVDIII
jgi:hypothetical protein